MSTALPGSAIVTLQAESPLAAVSASIRESELRATLSAFCGATMLSAGGRCRLDANQRQQRLHNDKPATANGRRGNSTIPHEFIDLGSPKTGRFTRFCHSAGQPLRKWDTIHLVALRLIWSQSGSVWVARSTRRPRRIKVVPPPQARS